MRLVFMGTPEFSVPSLEKLAKEHEIVGVYCQPDRPVGRGQKLKPPPVKAKALELGLPVFQPRKLTDPGEFEKLQSLKPEAIVVVAFGQILKKEVIDLPPKGCVNIHSSLLPRWRGAAPIQWAILSGDKETGITTMRIVEKLDAGDVLLQERTPISADDTGETVHDRLATIGADLILKTLDQIETLKPAKQDEAQVTYAKKLSKGMEILDWKKSAHDLDRQVRALSPWPGTSVWVGPESDKRRLKIKRAKLKTEISGKEGFLFERAGMILMGCKEGCLELLELQWEGKKSMEPAEFLNGLKGQGMHKLELALI